MLRAATIVTGSTVCCVQSKPGNAMPLVNAPSARRVILGMMRRERHRGSQLNRRGDEPLLGRRASVCDVWGLRSMSCPVGADRMRAPWPLGRTEQVPCGTDVMTPTYACAIPPSTSFEQSHLSNRHADHRRVEPDVPRGGVVNARRPGQRPGRSEAKSVRASHIPPTTLST
jgi:hypothetical protein